MDNNNSHRKYILLILGLTALVALFIFYMSSKDADQSMGDSIGIDRFLASIFVDGFDEMSEDEQYMAALTFDEPVRHVAHFMEFAALGALLYALSLLVNFPGVLAFAAGALYGVIDEIHQIFVAGRGCQIGDMCFDTLGVLTGCLAVCLISRIVRKRE